MLIIVGVVAALCSWAIIRALGQYFIPALLIAGVLPALMENSRLRNKMIHFATAPNEFQTAANEFQRLVAAGEDVKAREFFRDSFGLSALSALPIIKSLKKAPNQPS